MNYGINFSFSTVTDPSERAENIRKAGFTHTFLWRYKTPDGGKLIEEYANAARRAGLTIETVHAEYVGVNDMWRCKFKRKHMYDFFKECIADAAKLGIPIVVIHVSSGELPPPKNRWGLNAYRELCEFAAEKGVFLAFENLRKKRYLAYIMENISLDSVRFCFDCGHENLYDGGYGILERYKDKLVCVHLHDNYGKRDDHMIPFDASIDFDRISSRLADAPETSVMLEIDSSEYGETDEHTLLSRAFSAAEKIGISIAKYRKVKSTK